MSVEDKAFWLAIRQAVLMALDALERRLEISPTTAELRQQMKQEKRLIPRAESDTMALAG